MLRIGVTDELPKRLWHPQNRTSAQSLKILTSMQVKGILDPADDGVLAARQQMMQQHGIEPPEESAN